MRNLLLILFLLSLLGCQKSDITDGVWITKDYANCPYVIKFSDGLLIENLTGKSLNWVSQYEIHDSILIVKVLTESFYDGNKIDTINIAFKDDVLILDSLSYLRIGRGNNYLSDFLNASKIEISLPQLNYNYRNNYCSDNSIIIPKQDKGALTYYINDTLISGFDFPTIIRKIISKPHYSNSIRFIIDSEVDYGTVNLFRDSFRRIGLFRHEYLYLNSNLTNLDYFETFSFVTNDIHMSEEEYEHFDDFCDSFGIDIPLPPPPPPIFPLDTNGLRASLFEISSGGKYYFNNEELQIDSFGINHISNIINNNHTLMLDINDSILFEDYLNVKLMISKSLSDYQDTISLNKYGELFNHLDDEFSNEIEKDTWLKVIEISRY